MPRPATQIHVAQPCHESWAAMTPTSAGRHCAACQKVVVDFTRYSDTELLAYLARTAGAATCGRFRAGQLARPLHPAEPSRHWRAWLASVLALGGVLGSGRAVAQAGGAYYSAGPAPVATHAVAPAVPPTSAQQAAPVPASSARPEPFVVRGKVVDNQGLGLPGVTVLLQGTALGMSTNITGDFELTIPADVAHDSLLFSYVGYAARHLPVPASPAAPLVVQLTEAVTGEMGVVVVGGYSIRKPWPWHPRRLYQWSKYQLLRPFRSL